MKKYLLLFLLIALSGCDDYNGYESKMDERWAKTLKHAYSLGYLDGMNALAEMYSHGKPSFPVVNEKRYADSCKYAEFVDKIIKNKE